METKEKLSLTTDISHWEYKRKLAFADRYIYKTIFLRWDDLPDINSLHDCETPESIIEYCNERIAEAGGEFLFYY